MPARTVRSRRKSRPPRARGASVQKDSPAARLEESEALFRDFAELTPYRFTPFVRSFESFDEYERWRRAQTNPWYR